MRGFPFNVRKLLVLELFNGGKLLSSGEVARKLQMQRYSAASALLRYWRLGYLCRKARYTGKPGHPPFLYSRTEKGDERYHEYKLRFEHGIPLNLHRYKLPQEGRLVGLPSDLDKLLLGESERDESQDQA